METKNFDLSSVLSVITGRILTNFENISTLTGYLINTPVIYTTGVALYQNVCSNAILEKYPNLALIEVPESLNNWDDINKFIDEQTKTYGNSFELSPLSKEYIEAFQKSNKFKL